MHAPSLCLTFIHSEPIAPPEAAVLGKLCEWGRDAGVAVQSFSESDNVTAAASDENMRAVLISGHVQKAPHVARAVRRASPDCWILFVSDEQQTGAIRRQLGVAPMLGKNWKFVHPNLEEIQRSLLAAQQESRKRQQVRTTIRRVSEQLAEPRTRTETRYRRQMLSEQYLLSVLAHGFDVVICFGAEQQVIAWNAAAEELFELPEVDVLGRTVSELASAGVMPTLHPLVQAAFGGVPLQRTEQRHIRSDRSARVLDVTVTLVKEDAGALPGVALIARDITERRRAEEQVYSEREWLRTTLASIGDAVIATDAQGRVVFMNAVAESLTGWTQHQAAGQSLESVFVIVNEDTRRPVQNPVEVVLKTGSIVGLANHTVLISRNGTEYPIDDSAAPIRNMDRSLQGVVLVFRDVTARRAAERALVAARDEAERANKAKDRFLAVLSHELRTPLTPVIAALDTLGARDELPIDIRSDLALIRRNVMLEARLIDDLLDINRISKGKLQLQIELIDLHRTLEHSIDICRLQAAAKEIHLISELHATSPRVCADLARLQQVFWNLVQNAVKFTPKGGTVTVRTRDLANARIEISVHDTGVGIRAEVLPKIFDPFEQGTTAVTRQFGGLGLGLAICRALVEAHEGTITASSAGPNQGATFSVQLKRATEADCAAAPPLGAPSPKIKQTYRILLVEDHEDTRATLERLLKRRGHTISTASSVEAAMQLASRETFDLLITDVGLPDATGHELIRRLREVQPEIMGIALSGFGMEEDIAASISAGFSEHLTKPVNFQQLEEAIQCLPISPRKNAPM